MAPYQIQIHQQGAFREEGAGNPLLYFSVTWFELEPIDIDIKYNT